MVAASLALKLEEEAEEQLCRLCWGDEDDGPLVQGLRPLASRGGCQSNNVDTPRGGV